VDLNGDGKLDILSGSYSRQDQDMAGLFQVLWGQQDGSFAKAKALDGSDGQPLILPRGKGDDDVIDRICTRAFAVDLDGDGKLDLVSGNFRGTFAWFRGEGEGKFEPQASWLEGPSGKLEVQSHSDPFFVDWDRDGDVDMLSGSAQGGVFLFRNDGTKQKPKFAASETLLPAAGGHHDGEETKFGDAHLTAPGRDTRVWADDVDGDGLLDLLVGDQHTLLHLQSGVSEADGKQRLATWREKQQKFFQEPQEENDDGRRKWQERYQALEKERDEFAKQQMTGFVWLLRQKVAAPKTGNASARKKT
jgi:hypothetical protein